VSTTTNEIAELASPGAGEATDAVVGRALLAGQQAADVTLAEARAEGERIRVQARAEAEGIRAEARADAERLRSAARSELARLDALISELRAQAAVVAEQANPGQANPTPALSTAQGEARQPAHHATPAATPTSKRVRPTWWATVPLEAALPIAAILVVLLVMLALMG
jgi:hypothetical protein